VKVVAADALNLFLWCRHRYWARWRSPAGACA
jgi:hypothetical protein